MDVENPKNTEQNNSLDIGALLCEARDNLGLTTGDIADKLNLASDIIGKIETNEFEQDIPAAFIRGYLKSYVTKVGLDTALILSEFDRKVSIQSPSLKRVDSIAVFKRKRKEINSSSYLFKSISILIVLIFLSFAGREFWKRYVFEYQGPDTHSPRATTGESNQILLNSTAEGNNYSTSIELDLLQSKTEPAITDKTNDDDLSDPNQAALNAAQNETRIDSTNTVNQSSPVLQSNDGLNMTNLVLEFSDDCWVKIVDARGEVIALGVKKNGKHMPLVGVAPFNVILGDPSVVTMIYAGQNYELSGYPSGRRAEIILN